MDAREAAALCLSETGLAEHGSLDPEAVREMVRGFVEWARSEGACPGCLEEARSEPLSVLVLGCKMYLWLSRGEDVPAAELARALREMLPPGAESLIAAALEEELAGRR